MSRTDIIDKTSSMKDANDKWWSGATWNCVSHLWIFKFDEGIDEGIILENQTFIHISVKQVLRRVDTKDIYKNIKFQDSSSREIVKGNTCPLFFHNLEWPHCFKIINSLLFVPSFHLSTFVSSTSIPLHYGKQT